MLGLAVLRVVDLSYEGADELVFARYDPATDAVSWVATASG